MGYPEKIDRNRLIYERYQPKKHGYKKLAKEFDLEWPTVRKIVKRWVAKEGVKK